MENLLNNLKIDCSEHPEIIKDIDILLSEQKRNNREFISLLVNLEKNGFRGRYKAIAATRGKDEKAILNISRTVKKIMDVSTANIKKINELYFNILLFSLIALILTGLTLTVYMIRKGLEGKNILEKRVRERTEELNLAVKELHLEIKERLQTEESLIKTREKIEQTLVELSVSEKKYRMLVENTKDIVFTLDSQWNFITANNALSKEFRISSDNVRVINFLDLIYVDNNGKSDSRRFIKEKLDSFYENGGELRFSAEFISVINNEPKEMEVSLELVSADGRKEIIGKMRKLKDEELLKYLSFEKQRYEIGNYLITADDITHQVTWKLHRFMSLKDVNMLRIALREILINAIEHGNLDITFEEKSEAMICDNYFEFIAARRSDPRYKNRKVTIEYMIDSVKAVYRITDEGRGFDHKGYINKKSKVVDEDMISHGRGIKMTMKIFDLVKYNQAGNEVMLVKKLPV